MSETSQQPRQKALSVDQGKSLSGLAGCFGYAFGFIFSSMFFGMGSLFLWLILLQPLWQIVSARSWQPTPCTILSSKVEGNDTYRVAIEYDYEYAGQRLTGNRYSFSMGSTSGRKGKEKVVARYPVGAEAVCYVNPFRPQESVLHRGLFADLWWGLFPIPFMLVGLVGYGVTFFSGRWLSRLNKHGDSAPPELREALGGTWNETGKTEAAATMGSVTKWSNSDFDDDDLQETPGPVTLKPETSRAGAFGFLLFFSLIWNGVTWGILSTRFADWQQGKWEWMPELILIPFAVIGLVVIVATIHQFLAMFNPLPTLTLSRQLIPLGGEATVAWEFDRSPRSIRSLKLTLKGIEEARYRRGTSTYTDTETFHEEVLFESTDPYEIAEGNLHFRIPDETMHSFNGNNNKIKWQVQFQGEIPLWPDVSSSFSIRVVPHE